MMRIMNSLPVVSFLGFLLFAAIARGDTAESDLDAANSAYQNGHFDDSAQLFRQLIEAKGYSAPLLLDAGNAELKAGHLGAALLDYERARFLAPLDRGIDQNLQAARHQAGLDPDPYRWWQIVIRTIDWMVWLVVMLTCLALILLAIIGTAVANMNAARQGPSLPGWRKFFRALLFICIPLGLFFGFVELSAVGLNDRVEGVILVKNATLRLSPFESAEKTGAIPEGELVTVEQRHNGYFWIDDRSRQSGWVSEKELAPVVPGGFATGN